jgi:hypothetical protein
LGSAPLAKVGHSVQGIPDDKRDRIVYRAFGKFSRLADKIHHHADTCAAFEIGPERDKLLSGYTQSMIQ